MTDAQLFAKAIRWIRANCLVNTGDGIPGEASRYTPQEIRRAIQEWKGKKDDWEPGR